MNSSTTPLLLTLWLGANLIGPISSMATAASPSPAHIPLTVDAADVPRPALRYSLFHDVFDQVPGNAAVAYARATRLMIQNPEWNEHANQIAQWLSLPPDQFPVQEATALLAQHRVALDQVMKATLHEYCDWEIPIRREGSAALLPHLSELRSAARLLALDIRLSIREGRLDDAIERLRAGLTMARHVGNDTLLISGLVGAAITHQMIETIEEFIQQPGAPNLYWALTDLPPASLNIWRATLWERSFLYVHLPVLREIGQRPITAADLQKALVQFHNLGGSTPSFDQSADDKAAISIAALGWVTYPVARRGLARQGMTEEQLDNLGAAEILVRFVGDGYRRQRDDLFKWFAVPYPQARVGLAQAHADFEQAVVSDPIENMLARMLLPAIGRAADRFAEVDRQFAVLRCIEALRFHAAQHDQQLPASLDAIESLPIPPDPMTGLPFQYRLEGPTAILQGPPVPGEPVRKPTIYEITIRP
jgi:hypothetical protein